MTLLLHFFLKHLCKFAVGKTGKKESSSSSLKFKHKHTLKMIHREANDRKFPSLHPWNLLV